MEKSFPVYKKYQDVSCFNCDHIGGDIIETDFAKGAGHYRFTCSECGYHTYFDLKGV